MPTSRSVRTTKSEAVASAVPSGFDVSVLHALLDPGARQHQLEAFRQRAEDKRTAGAKKVEVLAGINIGRSGGNQVQLARAGVSRRHAMITIGSDGRYTIQELQSQNGTFANGERITEAALADGDRIAVGDVQVTFRSNLQA